MPDALEQMAAELTAMADGELPIRYTALREMAQTLRAMAEIPIQDRHRVLDEWPSARDAIRRWVEDPAPKLSGLSIRVRVERVAYGSGDLEIRLERHVEGYRFEQTVLVSIYSLLEHPNKAWEIVGYPLIRLHEALVEMARRHHVDRH